MSKSKSTTAPSILNPQAGSPRRPQSNLDWNTPKKTRTPRSEYRFMREYAMVWARNTNGGPFGGFNGGVAQ